MPEAIGPSVIRISSQSEFGPHESFVPTLLWTDAASTNNHGKFDTWNGGNIDAVDMINDLMDVLKPFFDSTTTFNDWVIFSQADPTAPLVPVQSDSFTGVVGTTTLTGWRKAMQRTMSFRTESFNLFKIVMLDIPNTNNWDKLNTLPGSGIYPDLVALVTDKDHGFSGRDNTRPVSFISATYTLNEKLRRAYRMT